MGREDERVALEGATLSAEAVQDLERRVRDDSSDVDSRLKVLGYLGMRQFQDAAAKDQWSRHALWFIEHMPESDVAGSPFCQIGLDDPAFAQAREAWDRALAGTGAPPEVIMNAAHFLTLSDPDHATALLERGERVAPSWSDWARQLGDNLFREIAVAREGEAQGRDPKLRPDVMRQIAERALGHFERALAAASSRCQRFDILPRCAQAALECGRATDALRYADEIITTAPECPDSRHRPDCVHWAHTVRGHVALQAGDLETAIRDLAAAGMQGSAQAPVLRSFGPDFRLARCLLDLGKTEAVIAYLDRCATFWRPERIARWRAEIERGGRPRLFAGFDPADYAPPAS